MLAPFLTNSALRKDFQIRTYSRTFDMTALETFTIAGL